MPHNDIPDEVLTGEDLKNVLCHPSIGYNICGDMTGTYLLTRQGGQVLPLYKHGWGLKRSYIEQEVLSNFGVSKAEFIAVLNAVSSASASGSPPTTS